MTATFAIAVGISGILLWNERDKTLKALDLAREQERVAQSRQQQADANLQLARAAVDQMFVQVGEQLESYPQLDELRGGVLETALEFYTVILAQQGAELEMRESTATAASRVGQLQGWLGEPDKSEESYRLAIQLFGDLAQELPDDSDHIEQQIHVHRELAAVLAASGRPSEALALIEAAHSLSSERLAQNPKDAQAILTHVKLVASLSLLQHGNGVSFEMAPRYANALKLLTRLEGNAANSDDHLETRAKLARASNIVSRLPGTIQQEIRDRRTLRERSPENHANLNRLSGALNNLAIRTMDVGAEEPLRRERLEISRELVDAYPMSRRYEAELADAEKDWAGLLARKRDYEAAEQAFIAALKRSRVLLEQHPEYQEHERLVARCLVQLAGVYLATNQFGKAQENLVAGRKIFERLRARFPHQATHRNNLNTIERHLAICEAHLSGLVETPRHPSSEADLAHRVSRRMAVPAEGSRPRLAINLAKLAVSLELERADYWSTLGAAQYRAAEYKFAIESLQKAVELRGAGDSYDFLFLAMAYWQLGNRDQAESSYDNAVRRMDGLDNGELARIRAEAEELMREPTTVDANERN